MSNPFDLLCVNDGLNLPTFNVPPGKCCPGKSEWCHVDKNGYCKHGRWGCPSTIESLEWRLEQTRRDDFAQRFLNDMALAEALGYPAIRLHSAGDFYSMQYLRTLADVGEAAMLGGVSSQSSPTPRTGRSAGGGG